MPDEPENLTLTLLRDVRDRLERIEQRLDNIDATLQLLFNAVVDLSARVTRLEKA